MDDEVEYQTLSITHAFRNHQPKKKSKQGKNHELMFRGWWKALQDYYNILDLEYEKIIDQVFKSLRENLRAYIFEEILLSEDGPTNSPFQSIPCALVTVSNICDIPAFIDSLFRHVQLSIPKKLVISSNEVQSVPDFVELLKSQLPRCFSKPIEHNFYSVIAKKFNAHEKDKKPLIVIIEDFDRFDSKVVANIIKVIHENLEHLPVILICFQSSDILSLSRRFPAFIIDCVKVKNFSCDTVRSYFFHFLEYLCLEVDHPFRIGPQVFQHLTNVFEFWDSSLSGALRWIKAAAFEHYFNKPYTSICCSLNVRNEALDKLTQEDIKEIRSLPSMLVTHPSVPRSSQSDLVFLNECLKTYEETMEEALAELYCYHYLKKAIIPTLKNSSFLGHTWMPFLRVKSYPTKSEIDLLRNEIMALDLESIENVMNKVPESKFINSELWIALRKHYRNFHRMADDTKEPEEFTTRRSGRIISQPCNYAEKQLQSIECTQKRRGKLVTWKNDFLAIIVEKINHVEPPIYGTLNEVFYFDDVEALIDMTIPSHRESVLNTLEKPGSFLNLDYASSELPETSILYEIYYQYDRLLDLRQIYQEFKENLPKASESSPRKRRKKVADTSEKILLKRFVDAIFDLEFMGLLHVHPRNRNYLERLVWPTDPHSVNDKIPDESKDLSSVLDSLNISLNRQDCL